MCCRYYLEESPELRPIVEAMNRNPLADQLREKFARPLTTSGEVRPADIAPVVAPARSGVPAVFPMLWGFTNPRSGQPLINCRVETAKEKPLWKDAWAKRRCAIPMSWYFEWEHLPDPETGRMKTGAKYLLRPEGASLSCLAGLYRFEQKAGMQIPVFSVLTREPEEDIRFIHDRMPVILPKELVRAWISPSSSPDEIVRRAVPRMVFSRSC